MTSFKIENFNGNENIQITLSSTKNIIDIGEVVTFSIALKNLAPAIIEDIFVSLNLENGFILKEETLRLNNLSITGHVLDGIPVGNLAYLEEKIISFDLLVSNIPSINPIKSVASVNFKLLGESNYKTSNILETQVGKVIGNALIIKEVDKSVAIVEDILSYTIKIKNISEIPLTSGVFIDDLSPSFSFIYDSLIIDGTKTINGNPIKGLSIKDLAPGEETVISYKVYVNSVPEVGYSLNNSKFSFNYNIQSFSLSNYSVSNDVYTKVVPLALNSASLLLEKYIDTIGAVVSETVTYTINTSNTGSILASSVSLKDILPDGLTFVQGSVTIDGVPSQESPLTGINLNNLAKGQSKEVKFKAVVNVLPNINPAQNKAIATYTYISDPLSPPVSGSSESNIVSTKIAPTNLITVGTKTVDKPFSNVGDTLTYTLGTTNNSTIVLNNVVLIDTVPDGINFIPGSVTVNGVANLTANPENGVQVGNVNPGDSVLVLFKAVVTSIVNTGAVLKNTGTISYSFLPDAGGEFRYRSIVTNEVSTTINTAIISGSGFVKSVDKTGAEVGDILTYTIRLLNSGNVDATNVLIKDTLQAGTSFIPGSVFINGTPNSIYNPQTGINVGTLIPNVESVVSFKVHIDFIPEVNPLKNIANLTYEYKQNPTSTQVIKGASTSNETSTSIVSTPISPGINGFYKRANLENATIGDVIIFTLTAKNSSSVVAKNVIAKDILDSSLSFENNSVTIDGSLVLNGDIRQGIALGDIKPLEAKIVEFKAKVISIPSSNPIQNTGTLSYAYSAGIDGINKSVNITSAPTFTRINYANISNEDSSLIKSVDKNYVSKDETLTYTVFLKNTGNVSANNIVFYDTIPENTQFIDGTVYVAGINYPLYNPDASFNIGNLAPNEQKTITFKVKVTTVPNSTLITNDCKVRYNFTVNPNEPDGRTKESMSNEVTTKVNIAIIDTELDNSLEKFTDLEFGIRGDTITYTILLKNVGNVDALNVVFKDTVPNGTSFIQNTVTINDIQQAGVSPNSGIAVGRIKPFESKLVKFKVKVIDFPNPNPIQNSGTVFYDYVVNDETGLKNSVVNNTNTVTTKINEARISLEHNDILKTVDKDFAGLNEILTYRISLRNSGTVEAINTKFIDKIPLGTEFVIDSFSIDGKIIKGANPDTGVNIGAIRVSQISYVEFKVKIISLPETNQIVNKGSVSYDYVIDPIKNKTGQGSSDTNTVITRVSQAIVSFTKEGSKKFVKIGDIYTYKIILRNDGNSSANNVKIVDTLPDGVSFVENSLKINGNPTTGSIADGVSIGNINKNSSATIEYSVKVTKIPKINPMPNKAYVTYNFTVNPETGEVKTVEGFTNEVLTTVNTAIIKNEDGGFVKSTDKTSAEIGETISYKIKITNTGNVLAQNVFLTDPIPNGSEFINGSLFVNGKLRNENIQSGISLEDVSPSEQILVEFKVLVITIPTKNPLENSGKIDYNYIVNPETSEKVIETSNTNIVKTTVNSPLLTVTKIPNKAYSTVGDILEYTIVVTVNGNISANNTVVYDTLPEGVSFILGSLKINGVLAPNENIEKGVLIGNIQPLKSITLTYNGKVTKVPKLNPLVNVAEARYTFTKDPSNPNEEERTTLSNEAKTFINDADISYETLGLIKSVDKSYVDVGDTLTYTVTLINKGNTDANSVVLLDTLPLSLKFVEGTVIINGTTMASFNPNLGIPVGTIKPNDKVVLSFTGSVVSLPNPNVIQNDSKVSYNYTIDPSVPNGGFRENISNKVVTVLNRAIISNVDGGFTKAESIKAGDVGDIIDYTIKLKNTGNIQAENVVFIDTLADGIAYVENTLYVDGVLKPMDDVTKGLILSNIPSGETKTVTFKVKITKIPLKNPIDNFGEVSYKYLVDPTTSKYNTALNKTNTVSTNVNRAEISYKTDGFVKFVDKAYADVGEVLVYTIRVKNTGNTEALDVIFTDTVPPSTSFVVDSLSLNGVIKEGDNPSNGVFLGTIKAGEGITVSFKVLANSIPANLLIKNDAKVTYSYIVDKEAPVRKDSVNMTNVVTTSLRHGEVKVTKVALDEYSTLGATIRYELILENVGNVDVLNVNALDTVPNGTIFIDNSLKIDGIFIPGENLQRGVQIGTIKTGEKKKLEFSVLINTIPNENPIKNTASSTYSYILDPINNVTITNTKVSNVVETKVNFVIINALAGSFNKISNKDYADIGEKITYTIIMKNKGNTNASNIVFTDTVPEGTEFIVGSLKLNGEIIKNGYPNSGIDVGSLAPMQEARITFDVIVTTIPKNNPLINRGAINYRFTKDPKVPLGESGYELTNIVTTTVSHGEITNGSKPTPGSEPVGGFTKKANKEYARLNEEIIYSFDIVNTGNVPVTNVILTDLIGQELKFVQGSVQINGILYENEDPNKGITISEIGINQKVTVSLKALVVSLPKDNVVKNQGSLEYSYKVDPNKPAVIKKATSNEEIVNINTAIISYADLGFVKQVDKSYAKLNDILNYRIVLKNTGNVDAENVIFKDMIPMGTVFIKDSVKINNENKFDLYPQTGIPLDIIKPNETVVVEFKVKIVSVVSSGYIDNKGEVLYRYKVDPNKAPVDDQSYTNTVRTKLNTVDFTGTNFEKVVTPKEGTISDIVTYTFKIRNGGNVNASKVLFTDTLPSEVSFVDGSVTINGETLKDLDPRIGIGIATIKPNESIVISFKVKVKSLPKKGENVFNIGKITYENIVDPKGTINSGEDYSNVGKLSIRKAIIQCTKESIEKVSAVTDVVKYKVTLKNTGNVTANDIEIYDELPECLEFVENSVMVGCMNTDENIVSGIKVFSLDPEEEIEVMFTARVLCKPECGTIKNEVKGNYTFYISNNRPETIEHFTSNVASVIIENPELTITKCSNKEIAKYSDEIDYFITVENTGSLDLYNVKLIDLLPEELRLVGQTIYVNGRRLNGINLSSGVSLGDIKMREKIEICYRVVVVRGCCRKLIENKVYAKFIYKIGELMTPKKSMSKVCIHTLKGVSTSFQQLTIDGVCKFPCNMPRIEDIVNVTGSIQIINKYVIDTVRGYSPENKRITGHKLVVNGKIFESIEFIAQEPTQSTHYQSNVEKFSTFIVLPHDYELGSNVDVCYEIEDIHFEQIGEKEVFISVTLMLDAIITC
ncbi:MAG: hypothetical protein ACRC28_13860 [Clostridium sp.]|uniref:hypothetical protein n=1 Tax=Clostridium sp. TaxID=1506 RepID=UPI003F2FFE6A